MDRTTKKELYEKVFHTSEYFCYHPAGQRLEGWRLSESAYAELQPSEKGRLYCKKLGLWLGTWTGKYLGTQDVWLRFFDSEGNLVLTQAEALEQRAQKAEAEPTQLKAHLAEKGIPLE
jgi:hypothetical protein